MRQITLQFGRWKLERDVDYGIDHKTGWSAVVDGCVIVQFVSLWRAVLALLRYRREEGKVALPSEDVAEIEELQQAIQKYGKAR